MAFVPVAFFRRTEHFVIATFSQTLGGCLSGVSQAPAVRASLHERHDSTLIKKSEVWVYRSKKKKKERAEFVFESTDPEDTHVPVLCARKVTEREAPRSTELHPWWELGIKGQEEL